MSINITNWVIKFQKGSEVAFEKVYREYSTQILKYLIFLSKNNDDAQDISQDVWIKVIKKKSSLQKPELFKQWLYRISKTTFLNYYKKRKKELFAPILDLDIPTEGDDLLIKIENKELAQNIINNLTEDKKTIFWLRNVENYTNKEIAKILDIPIGTVRSRLFYITKELKQFADKENQ
ncbi:MAG: hypothetical protein COA79_06795 [Planctomycetota bacterium]|nr:MAG: hypothetical protein COA79_06795 [Planctomycetota bacterium]